MAVPKQKVFLDSTILIAFVDRADKNHPRSLKIMENLASLNYHLFTSLQNIIECYSLFSQEAGISVAQDFLQAVIESNIEILFPQKGDLISAQRVLRSNREQQISLREALNATLMEKKGIYQIITFAYWHNLFGTQVSKISLI